MANELKLKCLHCGHEYTLPRPASDEPEERTCPKCGSNSVRKLPEDKTGTD